MTKEEIREKLKAGTPTRLEVYAMMDALGLTYRKTNCKKCLRDYIAIISEEVGLIKDASEQSGFNAETKWRYLKDKDYSWDGHRLNQDTPAWVIRRFMASHKRAWEFFAPVKEEETPQIIEDNDTQENEQ